MKIFTTYEEPLKGKSFTKKQLHKIYKDMADKTEYPSFDIWFYDMLKSGVFEEAREEIKVLSGSFLKGCGVTVYHRESDNFYHLIVLEDKGTGKLFVEIGNKRYFEEDIEKR